MNPINTENLMPRIEALLQQLLRVIEHGERLDLPVSPAQDRLDALAEGINILIGDLFHESAKQRKIRAEYEQLFETLRDAVLLISNDGRVIRANSAALQLLGSGKESLLGSPFHKYLKDHSSLERLREAVDFAEGVNNMEMNILSPSGSYVPVAVSASYLPSEPNDTNKQLVLVARDLRRLRELLKEAARAEEERKRANALELQQKQLEKALEDLRHAHEALAQAQKMEAVGQLAAGIAHDFNNLLSIVTGAAELASFELNAEHPASQDLQQILGATERASALTKKLLLFSRKHSTPVSRFEVGATVSQVAELLKRVLPETIQLSAEACPSSLIIELDPNQFEQIIINLVLNARDAMPNGGKINLQIQAIELLEDKNFKAGSYVELTVQDNGTGIAPEHLERLFEPFFTTKSNGRGTGLGLATCYALVTEAGGTIQAESVFNQGSLFRVRLPRFDSLNREEPAEKFLNFVNIVQDGLILVIEDEPALRQLIVRQLQRLGYQTLEAQDGIEALRIFENSWQKIDLIISDLVLPHLSGEQIILSIRKIKPNVPVLYISGYSEVYPDLEVAGAATQLLAKPFELKELAKRVVELHTSR